MGIRAPQHSATEHVLQAYISSVDSFAGHLIQSVNPRGTFRQLLRTILDELDVVPMKTEMSKEKLLRAFREYLDQQQLVGGHVVLIFDEAQNLDNTALEEIRMLSNFESDKRKLVQIILVGQPELRHKLKSPELEQLRQRIAVRCHLSPLPEEETENYITHRLHVAGVRNGAVQFSADACRLIHAHSAGTPRLINVLANALLLAGFVEEKQSFSARDVEAAVADLAEAEGIEPLSIVLPEPQAPPQAVVPAGPTLPTPAATVPQAAPQPSGPLRAAWWQSFAGISRAAGIMGGLIALAGAICLAYWFFIMK